MTISDIDEAALSQFLDDVGPDGDELVHLFVEETRAHIARMTDTAGRGAAAGVGNDAHSLKSAAATYGLSGLAKTARELEAACDDGDGERARELLDEIGEGVEAALTALLERIKRPPVAKPLSSGTG